MGSSSKEPGANCGWAEHISGFLDLPPFAAEYAGDGQSSVVERRMARRSRGKDEANKQRMLQIVFAAFIDLMCDAVPEESRAQLRNVLSRTVTQCRLVPAAFLSDDLRPLRAAFSHRIAQLISNNFSISPNIDNPLVLSLRESTATLFFPSRYRSDFEEIQLIGKGGFGTVFLVRSRIDNCKYAVKKIPFSIMRNSPMVKVSLNEVRLLASLQHANIVRYFGAWVEMNSTVSPLLLPKANIREVKSSESEQNCSTRLVLLENGRGSSESTDSQGCPISFDDVSCVAKSASSLEQFAESVDVLGALYRTSDLEDATMYVQMELCSRTLCDYLDFRNSERNAKVDCRFNVAVMKQLFSALDYIHSNNIIHRDVKPCNVFLRDRNAQLPVRVLLGDFGLACYDFRQRNPTSEESSRQFEDTRHSIAVGTTTYSAPEQLSSTTYDSAVDIYSAGIICYELYQPFATAMERVRAITNLRAGRLDADFEKNWPNESCLVRSLCDAEPCRRPHAFEALNQLEQFAESELDSLKRKVVSLEDTLRSRDEQIQQLRNKIDLLERLCRQFNVPLNDLS
ncbi:Eukaryotic translation initiation factor 2-alpha kinase 1 [Toxocara canis]|uniref:Eukaryotic translation initiation factor 2-alpha kinase 1 n=1 Tax=Toxocara canis TaxID=6265 RepID=A0A0B2V3J6_TOXCA|nr:Eukaryotic translation initiation factor 2-alpha kinase 1 [Toxocara canis]